MKSPAPLGLLFPLSTIARPAANQASSPCSFKPAALHASLPPVNETAPPAGTNPIFILPDQQDIISSVQLAPENEESFQNTEIHFVHYYLPLKIEGDVDTATLDTTIEISLFGYSITKASGNLAQGIDIELHVRVAAGSILLNLQIGNEVWATVKLNLPFRSMQKSFYMFDSPKIGTGVAKAAVNQADGNQAGAEVVQVPEMQRLQLGGTRRKTS